MNLIEKLGGYSVAKEIINQNSKDFNGNASGVRIYHFKTGWIVHDDLANEVLLYEQNVFSLETLRDCDIPPSTIILER